MNPHSAEYDIKISHISILFIKKIISLSVHNYYLNNMLLGFHELFANTLMYSQILPKLLCCS